MTYMKGLFDDWQAKGITSVLHEKKGGYANNTKSLYALAKKAEDEGVRIVTGVAVPGPEKGQRGAVTAVAAEIGRAARRDRGYQVVSIAVVCGPTQQKNKER